MRKQCTICGANLVETTGSTYCPNEGNHQQFKPSPSPQMICPKALDCSCKARDRNSCPRATLHEYEYSCCGGSKFCPPCVEYVEPSSPAKLNA
jgi:hypothetical protein